MSCLTLEALHPDIIIEILHSFENFGALNTLINSSPVCYRLFNFYSNSILAQVARNVIGEDAWEEASIVLAHQRKCRSGYFPIENDPESKFVLDRGDILQLLTNQRFFHICCTPFAKCVSRFNRESASDFMIPSFADGDTLPIKAFYQAWVFALHFGSDSINTFASRKPLSQQQCADMHFVSHVMYRCCDTGPGDILGISIDPFAEVYEQNLFILWGPTPRLRIKEWPGQNPLLRIKLLAHLRAAYAKSPMSYDKEFQSLAVDLVTDYEVKSLEYLLEKYKLSGEESLVLRWR